MSENGLEAISRFAEEGIKTNCTLIFTANQGLLAAKAGRLACCRRSSAGSTTSTRTAWIVIRELAEIFAIHDLEAEVLAASIRNPLPRDRRRPWPARTSPRCRSRSSSRWSTTRSPTTGIVQFKKDWEKARAEAAAKA